MNPITIISFGYRHAPAPSATITLDLREVLHDPAVDPRMRELTGLDPAVNARVAATPGAAGLLLSTGRVVHDLVAQTGRAVTVAIGCAGGRHRSVSLAEELAVWLRGDQLDVVVEHRDIAAPVLAPA